MFCFTTSFLGWQKQAVNTSGFSIKSSETAHVDGGEDRVQAPEIGVRIAVNVGNISTLVPPNIPTEHTNVEMEFHFAPKSKKLSFQLPTQRRGQFWQTNTGHQRQ